MTAVPGTKRATGGAVAADHHLASTAGIETLASGGSAADAAVAAAAVMTVVSPHSSGLGGDLFAVVHHGDPTPEVLQAVGRAGSGSDPDQLRREGHRSMPVVGDVRTATVPGCPDGWVELHRRHGRLPLAAVLAPAQALAANGFVPAAELGGALLVAGVDDMPPEVVGAPLGGPLVHRPELAGTLAALAEGGRDGFYAGRFGAALVALAPQLFTRVDLERPHAEWVTPLVAEVFGHRVWAPPPPSQAYIALAAGWIATQLDLAADPADPGWAHLLSECVRQAASDRIAVLHEDADGSGLVDPVRLRPRVDAIDTRRVGAAAPPPASGCTTYLCAVDADGMGVSLIQSLASSFGSQVVVPGTGVVLHNRGQGFSLEPGHPAELGPGRRPPHTLAPVLVTSDGGDLRAVLGTRGADAQPQVVLQLLARLLRHGESPATALRAGRWLLAHPERSAFGTWVDQLGIRTRLEAHAAPPWAAGLASRGHDVAIAGGPDPAFGSAHVITVDDGVLAAAADPRTSDAVASVR